jgi:thioredoxin:protein disulfide reductase
MMLSKWTLALMVLGGALAGSAHAQLRPMKVDVTPAVPEGQVFRAGAKGTVTLRVKLPESMHVQSDKPRDKSLIPTALTIEAPAGIRVEKIVYPTASTLKQEGQTEPLAVFGPDFTIIVHLAVAPNTAAGELQVPAKLRYQACDEVMCYRPVSVETRWTIRVTG